MTRHSKIDYFDPSNDVIHFHILTDVSHRIIARFSIGARHSHNPSRLPSHIHGESLIQHLFSRLPIFTTPAVFLRKYVAVGRTSSLHYYYLAFIVLTYLAYLIAVNTSYRSSLGTTDPGIQASCCIRLGYLEKVRKAHFLLLLTSRISSHSIVPIRVFS
jgi:hypothetical protein